MEVVLDASVIAKWYLNDEVDIISAKIKNDFRYGRISITAPAILLCEILNILKSAVKSKRMTQQRAFKSLEQFLNFGILYQPIDAFCLDIHKISISKDISAYDASYVVLANKLEIPLYTADEKLIKSVNSKLVLDYKTYKLKRSTTG